MKTRALFSERWRKVLSRLSNLSTAPGKAQVPISFFFVLIKLEFCSDRDVTWWLLSETLIRFEFLHLFSTKSIAHSILTHVIYFSVRRNSVSGVLVRSAFHLLMAEAQRVGNDSKGRTCIRKCWIRNVKHVNESLEEICLTCSAIHLNYFLLLLPSTCQIQSSWAGKQLFIWWRRHIYYEVE